MKIFSIIVTYQPDVKKLIGLTKCLRKNGSSVIIVENNLESLIERIPDFSDCIIIQQGRNSGLAHAQNIGIRHALNDSADIIVFFDQDSNIDDNFLSILLKPLKPNEPKVVGPCILDEKTNHELGSFVFNRLNFPTKAYSHNRSEPFAVDLIISSGTAVTSVTFQIVGLMDEDFFIDFVDFDWIIRCKSKKIPVYVVPLAILKHTLGESINKRKFFLISIHNPDRIYYQLRNSFLLLRKKHIPHMYILYVIGSSIIHKLVVILLSKNKIQYLESFYLGLFHGIVGKTGPKPKEL